MDCRPAKALTRAPTKVVTYDRVLCSRIKYLGLEDQVFQRFTTEVFRCFVALMNPLRLRLFPPPPLSGILVLHRTPPRILIRISLALNGAYYCHCACVLPISRYSVFLWVVPTFAGIFFAWIKTIRRKKNLACAFFFPKRKLGVTMHFLVIIKLQCGKKRHTFLCVLLLFRIIVA